MKRSIEVLIEKLDSFKKDELYWSTQIDATRKDIDNGRIGTQQNLNSKFSRMRRISTSEQ